MPDLSSPASQGISASDANTSVTGSSAASQTTSGIHKEVEPYAGVDLVPVEQVSVEIEVPTELETFGVEKHSELISVPPDVAQMGVEAVGSTQPVTHTGAVQLPLTDEQILTGLHAQIMTSLRWLAEWCSRQLKKTHVRLRRVSEKTIRVPN
jgi:hypothetical protein